MKYRHFFSVSVALALFTSILSASSPKEKYPQGFKTHEREGYAVCYSGRDRLPIWVFERLTSQKTLQKKEARKGYKFVEDPEIPEFHQANDADYAYSGYDKGHMAAASNHEYSAEAMKDTFFYSNACPQNPNCNRGIWKKLEQGIKKTLSENNGNGISIVDVYSGPLFLSKIREGDRGEEKYIQYKILGQNEVAVPTHFFKIVYYRDRDEALKSRTGYVLPNEEFRQAELKTFEEEIEKIERIAGLIFPRD